MPTVHELFEQQASRTPDAIAVVSTEQQVSYAELNTRAELAATYLRSAGVGLESAVGVCMSRGIDFVAVLLGVLKAGACYVPLDPGHPADRLRFMVADTGAAMVIADRELAGMGVPVVSYVDIPDVADVEYVAPNCHPDNLAYVMYTSGSTGRPKGVMVTHRGVERLVVRPGYVDIRPDDVVLQVGPLAFDITTFEIWAPLLNGARLVMVLDSVPALGQIAAAVPRFGVTVLHLTAPLFHLMVDHQLASLGTLRYVLTGGDVTSARHAAKLVETFADVRLVHCYGPTESTTFTCCARVTTVAGGQPLPIGRPVRDTRVLVLDDELYVGGAGLARGYVGRPGLTAERFVPDPGGSGERLYRTGDLVRQRAGGTLEFAGRVDNQVKIRGFRVEPGEVEAAVLGSPGVSSAVVAMRERMGDNELVAYVVPRPGVELDVDELRRGLAAVLPSYLVPTEFVELTELPLTVNGKVDRTALLAGARRSSDDSLPANPTEKIVADVLAEVLRIDRLGPHEDFFDVGGHSLLALRVVARLCEEFPVDLVVNQIFETPTAAGLSRAIEKLVEARVAELSDAEVATLLAEEGRR